MVTKPTKEFTDAMGRRRIKGNMDIELAIDMLEMAEHIDHAILFSGDGDFRRLVEAVQRRGVRVSVVSTIRSSPPMVSDDLRRQADSFVELQELAPSICAITMSPRDEVRAQPVRARRAGVSEAAMRAATTRPSRSAGPRLPLCPRLAAFRDTQRASASGLVQCAGALLRAGSGELLIVGWRRDCGAPTAPGGRSPAIMPATCCTGAC
jgi:hypothetical protein